MRSAAQRQRPRDITLAAAAAAAARVGERRDGGGGRGEAARLSAASPSFPPSSSVGSETHAASEKSPAFPLSSPLNLGATARPQAAPLLRAPFPSDASFPLARALPPSFLPSFLSCAPACVCVCVACESLRRAPSLWTLQLLQEQQRLAEPCG